MANFRCPVCKCVLNGGDRTLRCKNGHCFDLARQNYVNLLRSNQSSQKRHGDDRVMVDARREFLDSGYYACLQTALCDLAEEYCDESTVLLDVGCGEGYYTAAIRRRLGCETLGIDISKAALCAAHRRDGSLALAVASVNALPLGDGDCNFLLNVFAPHDDGEFHRVLAQGGYYFKVVPREKHLWELKQAIYDTPYQNEPVDYAPAGFELVRRVDVEDRITVTPQKQIENLFMMTPYYYKTGRTDQQKLRQYDCLTTEISFAVLIFRRM